MTKKRLINILWLITIFLWISSLFKIDKCSPYMISIGTILITFLVLAYLRNIKIRKSLSVVLAAYQAMFTVEMLVNYGFTITGLNIFILNMLIYIALVLVLYAITNSLKIAVIIQSILWGLFALTGYIVYLLRGTQLIANDLLSIKTAVGIVGKYKIEIYSWTWITLFLMISTIMLIIVLDWKENETKKVRIYIALCALVCMVLVYLGSLQMKANITHSQYKIALNMYLQLRDLKIEEPNDYSSDKLIELLNERIDEKTYVEEYTKPNIIIIMNESFSDMRLINDFATNIDIMPFFDSLQENVIKGYVYSSVFGGNTANSEYEFLTGDSIEFYADGSIPYIRIFKENKYSIVSNLKSLGYTTVAIHPYLSRSWNRENVYPLFGFDQMIFLEDFNNAKFCRGVVSDSSDYEKVIETIKTNDNPVFTMNITMQNHGGYNSDYSGLDEKITLLGREGEYPQTEIYLSLIHESDHALEELLVKLKSIDEPTVVLFFGDHLPNIEIEFYEELFGKEIEDLTIEEEMLKHKTPFFIWANFELEEKNDVEMSINYLSPYLLEMLNLPITEYQKYLLDLSKVYPIISGIGIIDNKGNVYSVEEDDVMNLPEINNYNSLIYNHMVDKDCLSEWFTLKYEN